MKYHNERVEIRQSLTNQYRQMLTAPDQAYSRALEPLSLGEINRMVHSMTQTAMESHMPREDAEKHIVSALYGDMMDSCLDHIDIDPIKDPVMAMMRDILSKWFKWEFNENGRITRDH